MSLNPLEKINNDTIWLLHELKEEEITNAYSESRIKFNLVNDEGSPSFRSQRRIIGMLRDRMAISIKPFYHNVNLMDMALEYQGLFPIGYWIQTLQPKFDEIYEEITKEKAPIVTQKIKDKIEPTGDQEKNKYFISYDKESVYLNNLFKLSSPRFSGENANFITYVLDNPGKKIRKDDLEKEYGSRPKKTFHSIVNELGFKEEIRKVFFKASKATVEFRNFIHESELPKLKVNKEKLINEMSTLKIRNDKEQ